MRFFANCIAEWQYTYPGNIACAYSCGANRITAAEAE